MTTINSFPSGTKTVSDGNVSFTKRALVNVILTNGFLASVSYDELENRRDWED